MRLTNQEANDRLNSSQNSINVVHKTLYEGQQKSQKLQVGSGIRALIGVAAIQEGNTWSTAKDFGVSQQTVRAAARGGTISSGNKSNTNGEVASLVKGNVDRLKNESVELALLALSELTQEKLSKSSAKELAGVANQLAGVHEKLSNKIVGAGGGGATVVIYAPRERSLDEFESIDVEAHVVNG